VGESVCANWLEMFCRGGATWSVATAYSPILAANLRNHQEGRFQSKHNVRESGRASNTHNGARLT